MAGPFLDFDIHSATNLGSMEIALAISLVLFGILIIQAYNYYQNYDDTWPLKSLATVISMLEVFHTITIIHTIYYTTVNLAGLTHVGPNSYQLTTGVVLEVLITAFVQSFFSFRIYRLSRKLYLGIICWALCFLRLGGGLALAAESYLNVPMQFNAFILTDDFGWLIVLTISAGAFVDIVIAALMCYYIKQLAPPDPSQSTGALIDRVIIWTIQTGFVTSITSVCVVIMFYSMPKTEIWFSMYTVLAKIYSNSFFASLNVRQRHGEIPAALSGLVFTSQVRPEFTLNMSSQMSRASEDSFDIPPGSILAMPEKALNSKTSFRREIDRDLEARGYCKYLVFSCF